MALSDRCKRKARMSREKLEKLIERGWERIELGPEDKKIMQRFSKSLRRQREVHRKALNLLKDFLKGNPKLLERLKKISKERPWFALRDLKKPFIGGMYLPEEKMIVVRPEIKEEEMLQASIHESMHRILMEYVFLVRILPLKKINKLMEKLGIRLGQTFSYLLLMRFLLEALPEAVTVTISGRGLIKAVKKYLLARYVHQYPETIEKLEEKAKIFRKKEEVYEELEKLIDDEKMKRLIERISTDAEHVFEFVTWGGHLMGELIARSFEKDEILELISKHPIEAVEFVFNNRERLMETIEKLDCPEFVKLFLQKAVETFAEDAEEILEDKEIFRDATDRLLKKGLEKYL